MKCKHENASTKYGEVTFENGVIAYEVEYLECLDCNEWLPMGPARDNGEHAEQVAIEVRAAMLAIDKDADETVWTPEEIGGGYVAACWEPGAPFSDVLDNDEQHAGYLAWLIEHHDAEQEG